MAVPRTARRVLERAAWSRVLAISAVMLLLGATLAPLAALADAGDLDPTFGGGRVTTNVGSPDDGARAVAVQPDGRVVVVGETRRARTGGDFAVIRYLTDGSLDPSFSGDGKGTTSFSSVYDAARDVAIQPNGKIVVVGTAAMEMRFAVARYTSNGSLDPSFHGDGKRTLNLSPGYDDAWAVAIQPDGRIVVAGYTGWGDFALARFMPNGSLDPSFGGDGTVVTSFGPGWDWAYDVALQANGKIVAVGRTDVGNGNFAVARYRRDGALDTSFSEDGKLTTTFSIDYDVAQAVAIQVDGRIVVAGFTAAGDGQFAVARYRRDGTLDGSFGGDGKRTTDFSSLDHANDVGVQVDGAIVAVGFTAAGDGDFALARYHADGTPDAAFGGDGTITTDFSAGEDHASGLAFQADGRYVVAGTTRDVEGRSNVAVAGYLEA